MNFSVLISVCAADREDYLRDALYSIWDDQVLKPDQVVLVKDGPVPNLEAAILEYGNRLEERLTVVALAENVGLGAALNEGLRSCKYELVARMDSDDLSLPDRFQIQVPFMWDRPNISASSAWIEEWDQDMKATNAIRRVPEEHGDICRFSKRRNPLSHPVVIFRKAAVEAVGGYPPLRKSQDYALWSLMLSRGHRMANIPRVLLRMRTGEGLLNRRGFEYFRSELTLLRYQKEIGFLGWLDFMLNTAMRAVVRLQPASIKKLIYKLAR